MMSPLNESSMSSQCHARASRSDRSWCYITNVPSELHSLSGLHNTAIMLLHVVALNYVRIGWLYMYVYTYIYIIRLLCCGRNVYLST